MLPWLRRVRQWLPRHLAQEDLDAEVRFHVQCRADELIRDGVSPDDALRRARLEFGPPERIKEQCRDARAGRLARELVADIRLTWRQVRRDRGLSATILATLTLAFGVTASVFAVVNAVVLDPLPYGDHHRLAMLWSTNPRTGVGLEQARRTGSSVAAGDFVAWRDESGIFEGLAAVEVSNAGHLGSAVRLAFIDADPNAEPARVASVSPGFFEVTGVRPRFGRTFTGNEPAVLLQEAYWRRRFQGREDLVGGVVWQDYGGGPWSRELRVVGVMPREFAVISRGVDYLQPFNIDERAAKFPNSRGFAVIGRLKAGLSLDVAQVRADAFAQVLERRKTSPTSGARVQLVAAADEAAGEFRPFMLALLAAVVMLVLVLAVNTASLLLLKAAARAKEVAVRTAIGASSTRLMRQALTESALLSLMGVSAGLALAGLLLAWLRAHLPHPKTWGGSLLQAESLRIDAAVVLFAVGAALIVGVAFGLLPAWQVSRTDVNDALKNSGPGMVGGVRRRTSAALVFAQFLIAAVLVTGSGLLLRSAAALYRQGPGFEHRSRLMVGVRGGDGTLKRIIQATGASAKEAEDAVSSSREAYWAAREQFRQVLLERAAALPGVRGVTSATSPVMSGTYWLARFRSESTAAGNGDVAEGLFTSVDSNYFTETGIPLREGRTFQPDDGGGPTPVAIVSEQLAERLWPHESAVGKRVQSMSHPKKLWFTIIGVVGDTRPDGMDKPEVPQVYEPWAQNRWWHGATSVILRSEGDPATLIAPLRQLVVTLDRDAYILRLHRLTDIVQDSAWRLNYAAALGASVAAVALLLATIGMFGVLSHGVRQRTQEIGLRIALGARSKDLATFVLRHVVMAVGVGTAAGLAVSTMLVRSLRALLFGIGPLDTTTFAAVAVVLATSALVAAAIPLLRALRLEPMDALRHD